jgi:hypothetical protein
MRTTPVLELAAVGGDDHHDVRPARSCLAPTQRGDAHARIENRRSDGRLDRSAAATAGMTRMYVALVSFRFDGNA